VEVDETVLRVLDLDGQVLKVAPPVGRKEVTRYKVFRHHQGAEP